MVFFLGDDDFESLLQARKYAKNLQKKINARDIQTLVASDIENVKKFFLDIIEDNFFEDKYIFIIKYFLENNEFLDYVTINWEKIKNIENLILFDRGYLDKKSKLFKILNQEKVLNIFDTTKITELKEWIKEISKQLDLDLDEQYINLLITRWSNNKWGIYTELKKFKLISRNEWNDLLTQNYTTKEEDLWNMMDLFLKKNFKKYASEYIRYIHIKKENIDQLIISILNKSMRNIALIKYCKMFNENIEKLRLNPYVLSKLLKVEALWSIQEIQNLIYRLIIIDNDVKSGIGHFNSQFLSLVYELV